MDGFVCLCIFFFSVFISSLLWGFHIKFMQLSCLQQNTFICFGFLAKLVCVWKEPTTESHLINFIFGSLKLGDPTLNTETHTHIRFLDKKWGRIIGYIVYLYEWTNNAMYFNLSIFNSDNNIPVTQNKIQYHFCLPFSGRRNLDLDLCAFHSIYLSASK